MPVCMYVCAWCMWKLQADVRNILFLRLIHLIHPDRGPQASPEFSDAVSLDG